MDSEPPQPNQLSTACFRKFSIAEKCQSRGGRLTADVIERLAEEGITSSVCLAYTDPIRLFLKTNFEWPFLIDIIDQALLFNYVRDIKDGLSRIRPLGIRGSIEMSVLGEPLSDGYALGEPLSDGYANPRLRPEEQAEKPFDPKRVTQAIDVVARKLGQDPTEVRNLAINLWEDGQVDLIWNLFRAFEETSLAERKERIMFTRVVELTSKPRKSRELSSLINDKVVPILKKQAGFVDEIVLVSDADSDRVLALSFWKTREDAERYQREQYNSVRETMQSVLEADPVVRTFEVHTSTGHKIAAGKAA
jgi:heme-degrading monooxygenase HmoA